jgi:hypothetical protein
LRLCYANTQQAQANRFTWTDHLLTFRLEGGDLPKPVRIRLRVIYDVNARRWQVRTDA